MEYIVTKGFNDTETGVYFRSGDSFNSQDETKIKELELSGYIAKAGSKSADLSLQQKENIDSVIGEVSEPYTVINGKVMPLSQAKEAQNASQLENSENGIPERYNNFGETVLSV